jgi:5-formyltetrahydrofolate cyclo-ligase
MKRHLRKEMKQLLEAMPPEEAAAKSQAACSALIGLEEFLAAQALMLYMPIRGEVDATPIALAAWQQDKTVLVPRVTWEQRHMIALRCRSLDDDFVEGSYGVREPVRGEPWPVEEIDMIVVPALAFDRAGNRLGRGGGFYDRFLDHEGVHAFTCGLAFGEQVVDELPAHGHDRAVHALVTDRQILRFRRTRQ